MFLLPARELLLFGRVKFTGFFLALCFSLISATETFAVSRAANLSTRGVVQTGDNVMIGGFIVTGSAAKQIVVRAIGPSLPLSGALADPILDVYDASGHVIASNDNWRTSQQDALIAAGFAPADDREAALIISVTPGAYTAIVHGANNSTGIALVEVYDLDNNDAPSRLANISTRGPVLTDDNVMIGGFIVRGDAPKKMLMRVRGPSLYFNGVLIPGSLTDPTLELHDANGAIITSNDNWKDTQQSDIAATGIAPTNDAESAILATTTPGNYTAILRGKNDTTGTALVEIYDLGP